MQEGKFRARAIRAGIWKIPLRCGAMNLRLVVPVLALTMLGGCIIVTPPKKSATKTVVVKERRGHPSEYWDGDRCVHKGKGKGKGKHKHRHHDD